MATSTRRLHRRRLKSGELGAWIGTYYDADGRRHQLSTRTTDRKAAEAIVREWERRAADPAHAATHKTTVDQALVELRAELTRSVERGDRAVVSLRADRSRLGHLSRLMGRRALAEVSPVECATYGDSRFAEGASWETIRKELVLLRRALHHATAARGLPDAGVLVKIPSSDYTPRDRVLSPDEAKRLLSELTHDRLAWCAAALALGAEASALQRLRRTGARVVRGTVCVHVQGTKTDGRDRWVPLVLPWQQELWALALAHGEGTRGALLRPWSEGSRSRDLRAACARAGVEAARLHDLRHTACHWLLRDGVSEDHARRILGHSSTEMVRRVYARVLGLEDFLGALQVRSKYATVQSELRGLDGLGGHPEDAQNALFSARNAGVEPATFGSGGQRSGAGFATIQAKADGRAIPRGAGATVQRAAG